MRFAAYAGASVALAAGTIARAFVQRANFYSAAVQISQSNACLMILTNVALLGVSVIMIGLQRLFYGPLRPTEVEQLYEKAWFAITETCLAMTIFREEVGGWFLIMFVSLLIGKIWGWIGEGRVEILEQQPPANPRLFHAQLSLSLLISVLFDSFILQYSVSTVLRHARPNMMVMFAFEFAVLTVTSISTAARYGISVYEARVVQKQIKERRTQIRQERERAREQRASQENTAGRSTSTPQPAVTDDDIETLEIDTPGWEEKGRWVFYLDLATDFLKLVLYVSFFCVLCMFYGMPIHIIRDVALTIRSFYKRITDFMRYRHATRDMNARYPDATAEDIAREDVCIICREDIRAWDPTPQPNPNNNHPNNTDQTPQPGASPSDERLRPKKLPCGHVLHFACLRSWLERQQICPTCRRPVLVPENSNRGSSRRNPQANAAPGQARQGGNPAPQQNVYQFGPIRIAFGVRNQAAGQLPANQNRQQQVNDQPHLAQQQHLPQPQPQQQPQVPRLPTLSATIHQQNAADGRPGTTPVRSNFDISSIPGTASSRTSGIITAQLQQVEQQLTRHHRDLINLSDQYSLVRAMQAELFRLRLNQFNDVDLSTAPGVSGPIRLPTQNLPNFTPGTLFASDPALQAGGIGSSSLPPGMTLPEGWTLTPFRPVSRHSTPAPAPAGPSGDLNILSHPFPPTAQGSTTTQGASRLPTATTTTTTEDPLAPHQGAGDPAAGSSSSSSNTMAATILQADQPASQTDLNGSSEPMTSTNGQTQAAAAAAATTNPHSVQALPQWGSESTSAGPQRGENGETNSAIDVNPHMSGEPSTTSNDVSTASDVKGKGKAPTVEDAGAEDD